MNANTQQQNLSTLNVAAFTTSDRAAHDIDNSNTSLLGAEDLALPEQHLRRNQGDTPIVYFLYGHVAYERPATMILA